MLSRVFHARCAKAAMIIAAVVCLAPLAVSIVGDVGGGLATPLTVSMPELLIAGLVYLGMFVVVGVLVFAVLRLLVRVRPAHLDHSGDIGRADR